MRVAGGSCGWPPRQPCSRIWNPTELSASAHRPLAPDLFSIKGLQNLGPRLREWRQGWRDRLTKQPPGLHLPVGQMEPAGYAVLQHPVRLDRPVKAYEKWMARVPQVYRVSVLDEKNAKPVGVDNDPYCLATLKHYRSLMPLASGSSQTDVPPQAGGRCKRCSRGASAKLLQGFSGACAPHRSAMRNSLEVIPLLARATRPS